jgi:nitrite reductase (NADH) small subunit
VSAAAQTSELVRVGAVADFPEGKFTILDVEGREIGVAPVDGRWYAARNVCPHHGAPVCAGKIGGTMMPSEPGELVFDLAGKIVRCPWHRWEFSLDSGRVLFTDEPGRLRMYKVVIEGDQVFIDLKGRPDA